PRGGPRGGRDGGPRRRVASGRRAARPGDGGRARGAGGELHHPAAHAPGREPGAGRGDELPHGAADRAHDGARGHPAARPRAAGDGGRVPAVPVAPARGDRRARRAAVPRRGVPRGHRPRVEGRRGRRGHRPAGGQHRRAHVRGEAPPAQRGRAGLDRRRRRAELRDRAPARRPPRARPGPPRDDAARGTGGGGVITLRGVTKRYGEQVVLDGLDLDLPDGAVTALMGPNGSGKTTLARLVLGLEEPDAGGIDRLAGPRVVAAFQEDRRCEQLSAVGNVRLVLERARAAEAAAAVREAGLADDGLATPVRELSGGQRRRVALVRALVADADVVVLVEPFKGPDRAAHARLLDVVRGRTAGRTVLLITH